MPNAKFRCLFCKDYFPRDQAVSTPKGKFCTIDHATKYGIASIPKTIKKLEREERKKNSQEVRDLKRKDFQYQIRITQPVFNRLIRLIDAGMPCISCGRKGLEEKYGGSWDCGHYLTIGGFPELRFCFLNAYRQCKKCNGGSGRFSRKAKTVAQDYTEMLVERMGQPVVDWLNGPHEAKHYTCEQLIQMRAEFSAEIRFILKNGRPSKDWRRLVENTRQRQARAN